MASNGGRIAPDGRTPQAPGVGRNARRHDLERPKTPGLHGSDLQQGDVQMLEQGQRTAPLPKQVQGPAQNRRRNQVLPERARVNGPVGGDAPDPLSFLSSRLAGTMEGTIPAGGRQNQKVSRVNQGLLGMLSSQVGTSGLVAQAYLAAIRQNDQIGGRVNGVWINQNALDDALEQMLKEG